MEYARQIPRSVLQSLRGVNGKNIDRERAVVNLYACILTIKDSKIRW